MTRALLVHLAVAHGHGRRWPHGALLAAVLASSAVRAGEVPTVEEIVARTEQAAYYQGEDGRAEVNMTITDDQGRTRRRDLVILRRNEPGGSDDAPEQREQRYYVHLYSPADVRNTAFLVWKHPVKDDDRWLYLPALDLVKRIAAGDKRTSFLGSDFYYEDISGRSTAEDRHELVETTNDYFVLDNTPKDPSSVAFGHFTMWIHRSTYLPVRVEYFDKEGQRYRTYDALKVETVSGHPTVVKSRMQDLRRQSETVLELAGVQYDVGLPDEIFSERYLRQPPQRYLR